MLVLGQTAAFLPVAVLGLLVALRRIEPRLIEAAEIAGLPWPTIALRVLAPMMRAWLIGVWAVVFVLSLNDAETAVLLAPAGQATLSVRIMTLLHYAPDAQVAALCVIQVVVTALAIAIVAGAAMGWRHRGRGGRDGQNGRNGRS
jgi:ABC-type spermidine/putrescine transport system permease subunit II